MARCCPTRASLPTGLYPHQAGIGHMMEDLGFDGYRGELNRECVTIAEVLQSAGYRTYMAGKWHVKHAVNPQTAAEQHNWPWQRGFDRFYGTLHGAGSFFDPNSLARDNQLISPFADSEYQPEEYYHTDAIADQAAKFVGGHRQRGNVWTGRHVHRLRQRLGHRFQLSLAGTAWNVRRCIGSMKATEEFDAGILSWWRKASKNGNFTTWPTIARSKTI